MAGRRQTNRPNRGQAASDVCNEYCYKSLQVVTNPDSKLLGFRVAGGRPGRPDRSIGTDGTDRLKVPLAARAEI
jgi:hypothetical protein